MWEQHAEWWQREFSAGADPEYERQILPLVDRHLHGARRVLDIGCGEGQVARRVAKLGANVVGLDPTPTQIRVARDRGGGPQFARARAEALPCADDAFDAVLLCLALEHVEAFELAIREVARVLEPGGRFVLLLAHPLLQAPRQWLGRGPERRGPLLADRELPRRRHRRRHRGARRRAAVRPSTAEPVRARDR